MIRPRSKSDLEIQLERVEGFAAPKAEREQYRLPAPAAAEALWYIGLRHGDLEGRLIVDLGCGTGMLAAGAAMMGADHVVGVDIDPEAVASAKRVAARMGISGGMDFIIADVRHLEIKADVVVQNPPFGIQVRQADRAFLKAGLAVAPTVYSIHRAGEGVRAFISSYIEGLGGRVEEVLPLKIKLPPTYHFHKKRFHAVDIDLYRIVRGY
ncbi:MAG: METTL5 family protein [Candidatus Methanomethylicia archaeon]|nr:METTL5 family protein [Candidatus Methanomethylicia archaeon]